MFLWVFQQRNISKVSANGPTRSFQDWFYRRAAPFPWRRCRSGVSTCEAEAISARSNTDCSHRTLVYLLSLVSTSSGREQNQNRDPLGQNSGVKVTRSCCLVPLVLYKCFSRHSITCNKEVGLHGSGSVPHLFPTCSTPFLTCPPPVPPRSPPVPHLFLTCSTPFLTCSSPVPQPL